MTIGELLIEYEQNHVINLKIWRGTSRRLQRYIAQLETGEQANPTLATLQRLAKALKVTVAELVE